MFLKQAVKDLFSNNAVNYWKDEGCNNRMRKYILMSKILTVMQLVIMLFVILYFIYISTISILKLQSINNIDDSVRFIINIYQVSTIGIIGLYVASNKLKKLSLEKLVFNIIKSLVILPLIALIMFYFDLIGYLMLSFWILIIFMIFEIVINGFNKRVKFLHEVSIGKEKVKNERITERIK